MRYVGARLKRVEDPRLLTGRARYLDDLRLTRMLSVAFVRSPHACAAIRTIDASAARRIPGVATVATAADLRGLAQPLLARLEGLTTETPWPALADGRAEFCGQAVAAVVADDAYVAADAAGAVVVDYEPLPAVATIDAAIAAGRILARREYTHGDVDAAFARAHAVVRRTLSHGRCVPSPLEPRGTMADWDGETLSVWTSTQSPQIVRAAIAGCLGLDEARVRMIVPDVGGGFGLKFQAFPEDIAVAALARQLGRPVKWIEARRENLIASAHAREQRVEAELAIDGEGRFLALRARCLSDAGAYHVYAQTQALEPFGTAAILPGPYVIDAYAFEAVALATNKVPLGAYRGVGMTMGAFVMERCVDEVAARLGVDPAEVRRRNLIPRERYPFRSASGFVYDSGDYPKALEQALAAVDYAKLRREQAEARRHGRHLGIGIACYTEYTGMGAETYRRRGMVDIPGPEAGSLRMEPDGTVRCTLSFPSQGQGHATTVAQLVADGLGIDMARVVLERVDQLASPPGSGTFASRGAVTIAGTMQKAVEIVGGKLRAIAADLLEAAEADIVLADGEARVRGAADRGVAIAALARLAYSPPAGGLPGGLDPGLVATVFCDPRAPTFSGAVHVAVVDVDVEAARVSIVRYVVVEDCGTVINPVIVEGQIQGAVAQGVGEALVEEMVYDDTGQPLTATLADYALPRAVDVPALEISHLETPSPLTALGVKGMGEGGTIGAPAAVANAVADALAPLGVDITRVPIRLDAALAARWRHDPQGAPDRR